MNKGQKFAIGDYVEANVASDAVYSITNHTRGWRGYVVSVDQRDADIGVVDEQAYDTGERDPHFWVDEQYFDLVPLEEIDVPDSDLFASLFG